MEKNLQLLNTHCTPHIWCELFIISPTLLNSHLAGPAKACDGLGDFWQEAKAERGWIREQWY